MTSASELLPTSYALADIDEARRAKWPSSRRAASCLFGTLALLFVLIAGGIVAGAKCGGSNRSLISLVKVGDTLHVISNLDSLRKAQEESKGTCDLSCQQLCGKAVVVVGVWPESVTVALDGHPGVTLAGNSFEETRILCGNDSKVAGIITATMSGWLVLAYAPVMCCSFWKSHRAMASVKQYFDEHPQDVFRMTLSGAAAQHHAKMMWGPGGVRRKATWWCCPWLELMPPLSLYVYIAAVPGARRVLTVVALSLIGFVIMCRCLRHTYVVCKYYHRMSKKRTCDIAIARIIGDNDISLVVVFDGVLRRFFHVGNIYTDPDNALALQVSALGVSQLVAHHEDPNDDTTAIVHWSLQVIYGEKGGETWSCHTEHFPVGLVGVHDFQRWLRQGERQRHLRFVGEARARDQVSEPSLETLFTHYEERVPAVAVEDGNAEQVDDGGEHVLTARCQHADAPGFFTVTLVTMAGCDLLAFTVPAKEVVADFLHTVAARAEFGGRKVRIVLANSQSLADFCPSASLEAIFQQRPSVRNLEAEA